MTSLLNQYQKLCDAKHIHKDPIQIEVLKKLGTLSHQLASKPSKFSFWKSKKISNNGLYIYGGVGRGKSMLMDLFFKYDDGVSKQRFHFHEFMLMIHTRVKEIMDSRNSSAKHPMAEIAHNLAKSTQLICFDEFHIKDITDAMLLSRLMGFLWEEGVVIVATSNFYPTDLYQDGYQRNLVEPFLKDLSQKLETIHLNGSLDYRQLFMAEKQRYFLTSDKNATQNLESIFDHLRQNAPISQMTLIVKKRKWTIPKTSGGVAWFEFDEICGQPLSANDYLELANTVHTVLISSIPELDDESLDRVKRFITLIDVLYDREINFAATGDVAISKLYTGEKEKELFNRTQSRLTEMGCSTTT